MSLPPTVWPPLRSNPLSAPPTARLHPAPTGNTNGAAFAKPSRLPRARSRSTFWRIVVPVGVLILVVAVGGGLFFWFKGSQGPANVNAVKVEYRDLQLKIVERGTLEAKENHDVKCEVKAGSRGAPRSSRSWTTAPWSRRAICSSRSTTRICRNRPRRKRSTATQGRDRQDRRGAKLSRQEDAIGLAKQNLDKWVKGDFPQQLHDLEGQIQTTNRPCCSRKTGQPGRPHGQEGIHDRQPGGSRAGQLHGRQIDLQKMRS